MLDPRVKTERLRSAGERIGEKDSTRSTTPCAASGAGDFVTAEPDDDDP